jgi:hypothetical protein
MPKRSALQDQIHKVEKRLKSIASQRTKQVKALRARAADAALHWIMANQGRVNAFRSSVKGTPVAKALDALLKLLRSEARTGKKKKKKAARRRPKAAAPASG